MTNMGKKIYNISQIALSVAIVLGIALFSTEAQATASEILKITGKLAECTYPQKRGGGACLEKANSKSCLNTTPFSPIGAGVTSEMCARGKDWCAKNDPTRKHKRCQNVDKGIVKNHEGYDYAAACGTSIFAPCDGTSTYNASSSTKPIRFKCDSICGKSYEFTFHHTQGSTGNGYYKKGKLIGRSGNATGYPCHMHIEIRQNGVILDPMNSGFDDEVCSCMNTEKVDRMDCFDGTAVDDGSPVSTGYDTALSNAGVLSVVNEGGGDITEVDEDCVYATVVANYEKAGCFFCKPFRILFNTASVMAKISYESLSEAVKIVVMVAFAIWLAMTIIKFVSSFEIKEPRILIKTLLNQSFRVLVVVVLLSGPLGSILDLTLNPVFSTGLKIAQLGGGLVGGEEPAECGLKSRPAQKASNTASTNLGANIVSSLHNAKDIVQSDEEYLAVVGTDVGGLSPELGNGIICTIKSIQDQIIEILAIARVSWCLSWEDAILWIIPNFGFLIIAIILFVMGFMFMMIYPFLLVDSILKMAIAIAIFPAALGAFAFKITAGYLQKIWNIFLNSIFTFIFLSLIILILTTITKQYMVEIITEDIKNGLLASIVWFGVSFLKITFVLFLGWVVLGEAKTFSDNFAKSISLGKGIGNPTGSAFGAATKSLVVKPAGKAAIKTGKFVKNSIQENVSFGRRRGRASLYERYGEEAVDEDGNVMTDEDGNTMYEDETSAASVWNKVLDSTKGKGRTGAGRLWNKVNDKMHSDSKTYRSFSRDENGNVLETKRTVHKSGTVETTRSDAYGSITEKRFADGTTRTTQKQNMTLRQLTDRRGNVDMEALRAFQQNSLFSEKEKCSIIMEQLINERMGNFAGGRLDSFRQGDTRDVVSGTDEKGNNFIKISQKNEDGSTSTFTATFHGNNRVMTNVETIGRNGTGYSYATDGIVQRKTTIGRDANGNEVRDHKYSVSDYYSESTTRPVFTNGDVAASIPRNQILFDQEDMARFGEQVRTEGNKAYEFSEFLKR